MRLQGYFRKKQFVYIFVVLICALLFAVLNRRTNEENKSVEKYNIIRTTVLPFHGGLIRRKERDLKWPPICKPQVLYNKAFQQRDLVNFEAKLAHNIRRYCSERGTVYDILNMKPIRFDRKFKNPCWLGKYGNGPVADGKIHCLPYFYILGTKTAGTSDIFARLTRHPLIQSSGYQEVQWWSRLRFGRAVDSRRDRKKIKGFIGKGPDVQSLDFYISMFDPVARNIRFLPTRVKGNRTIFKMITGDVTTNALLENPRWRLWPGNGGRLEPQFTHLHYIKHLTPNAKIIMLFRDPVERLYLEFLYSMQEQNGQEASPRLFHTHAMLAVEIHRQCLRQYTMRQCFYNETIKELLKKEGVQFAESFHGGFYAFLMNEIYSVFDKEHVLAEVMFDRRFSLERTLKRILKFFKFSLLSSDVIKKILQYDTSPNVSSEHVGMLQHTRHILHEFYKPYNFEMAILMKNGRYLFRN